jgi:hypothetical protein
MKKEIISYLNTKIAVFEVSKELLKELIVHKIRFLDLVLILQLRLIYLLMEDIFYLK